MSKRQKLWSRRTRAAVLELLGNHCQHCGTIANLEFDVIRPVDTGEHHKYDTSQRMSFYWRQYKNKNLQILCTKCNAKKGDIPGAHVIQSQQPNTSNNPF